MGLLQLISLGNTGIKTFKMQLFVLKPTVMVANEGSATWWWNININPLN
jgi:hypothetical protein